MPSKQIAGSQIPRYTGTKSPKGQAVNNERLGHKSKKPRILLSTDLPPTVRLLHHLITSATIDSLLQTTTRLELNTKPNLQFTYCPRMDHTQYIDRILLVPRCPRPETLKGKEINNKRLRHKPKNAGDSIIRRFLLNMKPLQLLYLVKVKQHVLHGIHCEK
jgi:hypothetical protein